MWIKIHIYFFCPVHVPDTILLSISWELCSKYIWVCLLIRIDVTFYLGNEIAVQMLRRAPVYWPGSEHLICIEFFICQPQYICWCSLVKQLSICPKLPWVLCFTSAYVSVSQYNTLCPIMKKAIPGYSMICLNLQFSRIIIHTPSPLHSPHTKSKETLNFLRVTKRIR